MKIKPIKTEADHAAALKRIEALWNATKQEDRDELDVLATLVDAYERVHHPIDPPDPIEAVKFRMEQQGWKLTDFNALIGSRSHSSEILNGKRPLNLAIIRKLHQAWKIPAAALLQEVKPARRSRSTRKRRTALPLVGLVPKKIA
jgi:HTH-type transcriptional regulator/antitoxin HigA